MVLNIMGLNGAVIIVLPCWHISTRRLFPTPLHHCRERALCLLAWKLGSRARWGPPASWVGPGTFNFRKEKAAQQQYGGWWGVGLLG